MRFKRVGRPVSQPAAVLSVLFLLASLLADRPAVAVDVVTGQVYKDELIDPDVDASRFYPAWQDAQEQPEGRRFYSVEYQHYREDDGDDFSEDGVLFNWRRETLDYGEFSLDATVRDGGDAQFSNSSSGGQFIFRQRGFALDEHLLMDNTAGVLRSQTDSMITSSFRLNLPSTLLGGLQTRVSSRQSDFFLGAGRIGQLNPTQIQGFEETEGNLFSAGFSHSWRPGWRAGSHLVHVDGSDAVADHQSVASALQYETPDRRRRYQGHLLVDSEGNNGVWLDVDTSSGPWRQRYGVFRLEPELLWAETSPTDDQQGGYLRAEYARLRYDLIAGIDLTQTNIDDRENRSGVNLYNVFVNSNWRMNSSSTLGGSLTARSSEPRNGISVEKSNSLDASGYAAHRFQIGMSRLQLTASQLERDGETGHGYAAIWDQDWELRRNMTLSSTLSRESESGLSDAEDTTTAALLVRHELSSRLSWNGDVSWSIVDGSHSDSRENLFTALALNWNFLPGWDASVRATYNQLDDVPTTTLVTASEDEQTLLLSVRYSHSSGRPFTVSGHQAAGNGYGEISGVVFYDANSDGRRQAGERPAAGVFIFLDRGYEAVTDNQGRFSFVPVKTGMHQLTLAVEDLPLPWGLLDESPRQVQVNVRETSNVDFPLQQINQ